MNASRRIADPQFTTTPARPPTSCRSGRFINRMRHEIAPKSASSTNADRIPLSVLACGTLSSSIMTKTSPSAAAAPTFRAAHAIFRSNSIHRTRGKRELSATTVPSLDPLSTTIASSPSPIAFNNTGNIHASISRRFMVGMIALRRTFGLRNATTFGLRYPADCGAERCRRGSP